MARTLTCLDPPLTVTLRRTRQARRLTLRVSRVDGGVHLTLPPRTSIAEASAFVARQEKWLRGAISRTPPAIPVTFGAEVPIDGTPRLVVSAKGRRVQLYPEEVHVPGDAPGRSLQVFLREMARDRFVTAVDHYAARVRRAPGRVTMRDPGSRWGSCTSEGNLMFSWRLIMAPRDVSDYVVAHEVAHLVEMNHAPAFWEQVAHICPGYKVHRTWLQKHGSALHKYRF